MQRYTLPIGLLVLFACKTKADVPADAATADAGQDAAPVAVSIEPGCRAYASAICAGFDRCDANQIAEDFGSLADCESKVFRECKSDGELPGSGATNDQLRACAKAMPDKPCPVERSDDSKECGDPKGTFPIGATCVSLLQCASLNCDRYAKGAKEGCGVCAAPRRETPRTRQKLGDRCNDDIPCGWHLACVKHTCVEQRKLGSTCVAADDSCETGTTCVNGKCIRPKTRELGESCTGTLFGMRGGPRPCAPQARCDRPFDKNEGKCVKDAVEGEACGKGVASCAYPFHCLDGKCVTEAAHYARCMAK